MDFPFRHVRVEEFCDGSVRPVSVLRVCRMARRSVIQRGSDGDFSVLPTNDSICSSLVHRQAVKTMLCYSARAGILACILFPYQSTTCGSPAPSQSDPTARVIHENFLTQRYQFRRGLPGSTRAL